MKPFEEIPFDKLPSKTKDLLRVYKNDKFLVQIRDEKLNGNIRLTINLIHCKMNKGKPIWSDGITWEELMQIKNLVGYAKQWCVECFPPEKDIVNVANMRHLWVLKEPPEYGWHK